MLPYEIQLIAFHHRASMYGEESHEQKEIPIGVHHAQQLLAYDIPSIFYMLREAFISSSTTLLIGAVKCSPKSQALVLDINEDSACIP